MKELRIFIASSVVEFEHERKELENFIHRIAKTARRLYGIDIVPTLSENRDPGFSVEGSQEDLNNAIRESDLCCFLFYTKAGEFTVEEFEVARRANEVSHGKKPTIYVYFKKLPNGKASDESLENFKEKLGVEYGYYYPEFEVIDTISFRLLLSLLPVFGNAKLSVENNRLLLDNKEIEDINLRGIPAFANSEKLTKLNGEFTEVDREYQRLRALRRTKDNLGSDLVEFKKISERRAKLLRELDASGKQILDASVKLGRVLASSATPSYRLARANLLFDKGKTGEALKALSEAEIDSGFENLDSVFKQSAQKNAESYIDEHSFAIELLQSQTDNKNRFDEIERRYEKITKAALDNRVRIDAVMSYIIYLTRTLQAQKAYELAKRTEKIIAAYPDFCDKLTECKLYIYIGRNLQRLSPRESEPEEYCQKAIDILTRLSGGGELNPAFMLGSAYNNMALALMNKGEFELSEKYYVEAVEIYSALLSRYSAASVKENLSLYCSTLGKFYAKAKRFDKAEEYLNRAKKLQTELTELNKNAYAHNLGYTYLYKTYLYMLTGEVKKMECCLREGAEIVFELLRKNPLQYSTLFYQLFEYAHFCYRNSGLTELSEKLLALWKAAKETDFRNDTSSALPLIISLRNAGIAYHRAGNYKTAELFYRMSYKLCLAGGSAQDEIPERELAIIFDNLGKVYYSLSRFGESQDFYLNAVRLYEKLAENDPANYSALLSDCRKNISLLFERRSKTAEQKAD